MENWKKGSVIFGDCKMIRRGIKYCKSTCKRCVHHLESPFLIYECLGTLAEQKGHTSVRLWFWIGLGCLLANIWVGKPSFTRWKGLTWHTILWFRQHHGLGTICHLHQFMVVSWFTGSFKFVSLLGILTALQESSMGQCVKCVCNKF